MLQRRDKPARIDGHERLWLVVRIDLNVLIPKPFELQRYPDALHEGTMYALAGALGPNDVNVPEAATVQLQIMLFGMFLDGN